MSSLKSQRHELVLRERANGCTFACIAAQLGVSPNRAKQIYAVAKRNQRRENDLLSGLSTRARNILIAVPFFPSKETISKAIESGELRLRKYRNCGKGTQEEICAWAGAKPPNVCPHCGQIIPETAAIASKQAPASST